MWTVDHSLPVGIADAPAATFRNSIYIFGGYGSSPHDVKHGVFEFDGKTWRERTPMPISCWGAAATVCKDYVYLFGGSPSGIALRYAPLTDTWAVLSNLPENLRALSHGIMASNLEHTIYLFHRDSVYAYDPERDEYSERRHPPVPRSWATCASVNVKGEDRIYVIGGYDYQVEDATNANYYYRPSADRWSSNQLPAPYPAYGVTRDNPVWRNKIYYGFGHTKHPNQFLKYMYSFDPTTNKWLELPTASHERDGVSTAILDGTMYVIGGRNHPDDEVAFGLEYNERLTL